MPDLGISPAPGLSQNHLLSDRVVVSAGLLPAMAVSAEKAVWTESIGTRRDSQERDEQRESMGPG